MHYCSPMFRLFFQVTVSKDQTIILSGGGELAAVEERKDLINGMMESTDSAYEKEKMSERCASLSLQVHDPRFPEQSVLVNCIA